MHLSKGKARTLGIWGILLATYTALVLLIPFARTAVFWLAMVFTYAAFGLQLYVLQLSFTKGVSVRSKFYGFPIVRVGVLYLGVQTVLSLLLMAMAGFCPLWAAAIALILPLSAALIGLIAADAMRDEVERQDAQLRADVRAMRTLQSRAAVIRTRCADGALACAAQSLADAFRYSDPVTNDATAEAERELSTSLGELERTIEEGDTQGALLLMERTQALLLERNRLCKLNKG